LHEVTTRWCWLSDILILCDVQDLLQDYLSISIKHLTSYEIFPVDNLTSKIFMPYHAIIYQALLC